MYMCVNDRVDFFFVVTCPLILLKRKTIFITDESRGDSRYLKAGGGALCPFVFDESSLVITVTNSPTAFPKSPERERLS